MMNHRWIVSLAIASVAATSGASAQMAAKSKSVDANYVQIVPHEADRRVDVLVGGKPFTSYVWPTTLKKPVLYPIVSSKGVIVTRGYPLDPRPNERIDHPHHAGLWFNYGDVNGLEDGHDRPQVGPRIEERRG
jgi:hypothetical protein